MGARRLRARLFNKMISERTPDWKRRAEASEILSFVRILLVLRVGVPASTPSTGNCTICSSNLTELLCVSCRTLSLRRMNSSTPIVAAQTRETPRSMSHKRAGIAPKDLRTMPQVQAAKAENMAMRSTSKQTVSTVVSLTAASLTAQASAASFKIPRRRPANSSCAGWIAEPFSAGAAIWA